VVWVRQLSVSDFRNIREARVELHPGVNVFTGRNAQGKTSVLEAVGVVARGRSFRTERAPALIRRGTPALRTKAQAGDEPHFAELEVGIAHDRRLFRVDGQPVPPREYHGRLEVVVYSTDRLRVVRGTMRDRRQFLDRSASALSPAYRALVRDYERVLGQRNAALRDGARDLPVWSERLVALGAELRCRRGRYAARLAAALPHGFRPAGEVYDVRVSPAPADDLEAARAALAEELEAGRSRERLAGCTLAGPHRDGVHLTVDGVDAADEASSGQARSLLLALALAALHVHREETGQSAVALLDDLDSELDSERAGALCAEVAARGQALVTSAHPAWAESLRPLGRVFSVCAGEVQCH
jgi:DNA replication and repair protein RecF